MKDIVRIESVQRKFTKRIPGMSGLTYSMLIKSVLESVQVEKTSCRHIGGVQNSIRMGRVNSNEFCTLKRSAQLQ